MKVKLFTKSLKPKLNFWMKPIGNQDGGLEAKINLWLASNPDIEIKNITQTQSGGSMDASDSCDNCLVPVVT